MSIDKKNIFLHHTESVLPYSAQSLNVGVNIPPRKRSSHADFVSKKLDECKKQSFTQKQVAAIRYKDGMYLEFSGAENCDLITKSLESMKKGIRLLNIREDKETKSIKATVYVPSGQESFFIDKVKAYATEETKHAKPKNNDLVNSIENVKLAIVECFWTGDTKEIPEENLVWCEVWLRYAPEGLDMAKNNFKNCCGDFHIEIDANEIVFPERVVKLAKVNGRNLKELVSGCDFIAEFRRAPESTEFFETLTGREQKEWSDELLCRTNFVDTNITVCILDTGVSSQHPLLAPAIKDETIQAVNSSWSTNDHEGHGTEMAGVALYNNLQQKLEDYSVNNILHGIESVKILPPKGGNIPELYGAVTEQAVALAEIANPRAKRTLCMAVTTHQYNTKDGSPTSWSAALDSITSGADGDEEKRLFIVSAGNVEPKELEIQKHSYTEANILHGIESPAQSWNALTVGAFAKNIEIADSDFKKYGYNIPVADAGELSPYSATSVLWDSRWPVKPEVLFDGGNMATNGKKDFSDCPDLSVLTTNRKHLEKLFTVIWGTSSSTAQAAWMAAQIFAEYPDAWPETVRGLIVHSAQWTDKMCRQFCKIDKKKTGRRTLLRTCGYGVPNLDRAIQCMNNSVNLIIQGELQPFQDKNMKDMHLHKIPWPSQVLESLGEANAEMKVTLSYFIEPGPGEIGWKDKYRYSSAGLRFDVINTDQTIEDFKKCINVKMRGDDKKDHGEGTRGNDRWYLGTDNRDVGSIHSDFWRGSAVDLCEAQYIAVYPVVGWWRERKYLGKSNNVMRYSLIVSLSTPEIDVDLYTPIVTQIKNLVQVEIPVT